MWREITLLEDKNQDQISTYTSQKAEFTESLHGLLDQIDDILKRDDEHHIAMELEPIKMPRFYPSDTQLWVDLVDIIRKAAEEH